MPGGNVHRILADLLTAFSEVGPGYVAKIATSTGTKLDENKLIQFVVPTWGAATNILILPNPDPGKIVIIAGAATGGELRSSAPTTVGINGGTGADAESAVAASEMVIAICESATSWKAFTIASNGTTAGLEAAA
tara:strand:- start:1099 stop:1503 length:405 start_codon:yes stop_codon:yes gene_type:complete